MSITARGLEGLGLSSLEGLNKEQVKRLFGGKGFNWLEDNRGKKIRQDAH